MGWKKDDGADGTKQRKFEASGDKDYKRAASAIHKHTILEKTNFHTLNSNISAVCKSI